MHEQRLCRQRQRQIFYSILSTALAHWSLDVCWQYTASVWLNPYPLTECSSAHHHHQSYHCITFAKPSLSCLLLFLYNPHITQYAFLVPRIFIYLSPKFLLHLGAKLIVEYRNRNKLQTNYIGLREWARLWGYKAGLGFGSRPINVCANVMWQ